MACKLVMWPEELNLNFALKGLVKDLRDYLFIAEQRVADVNHQRAREAWASHADRCRRELARRNKQAGGKVRHFPRLEARGERLVAQQNHGATVFAREFDGVDRRVETIFHRRRRDDDARRIAVAAKAGDVQIALLDAGRQARARTAALHIDDDQRHLGILHRPDILYFITLFDRWCKPPPAPSLKRRGFVSAWKQSDESPSRLC